MSQVLHIFKKDARHLWPEILISLALTAAFVRVSFGGVSNFNGGNSSNLLPLFRAVLGALVPVGWWVLAARVIHDESLVGESQFWVTRPYQWQELMAAKALFLAAYLYLPIFIAQVVLLLAAGFQPFAYLPGLFYNLVLLTGVLVLPIAAIATVTSNFARLVLTLLGAVAYLGLIIWFSLTFVSPPDQFGFPTPYGNRFTFSLFFLVFLVVIVLQYATRRTWRSRGLLLVLPFLAMVCSLAWPFQTIVRHLYPPLAGVQPPPVQLTFDPDPDRQSSVNPSHERTRIDLYLPLTVSGISSDSAIQNQGVQVSVESPNGLRWHSKWQNVSKYYRPDTSRSFIDIPIDEKFLDHVKSTPVTVTLTFALVHLHAGTPVTSQTADQDFPLAGGICSFPNLSSYPECRFAMTGPELAFVTARWTDGPCSLTAPSAVPGTLASTWVGTIDPSPAEFGVDPVKMKPLFFPYPADTRHVNFVCPDTPITAIPYSVVRRLQTTLAVPNLDLTKYTVDRLDGPARRRVTVRTR
jgi:hypothetical protein